MFHFVMKHWKSACIYSYFPTSTSLPVLSYFHILRKHLTAAKFKDCVRSCKVCLFCWKKYFIYLFIFKYIAVICFWKSSMCEPSTGLHVFVFKELTKLRVHSLEIKDLVLKENIWPSLVSSLFLLNLSQALISHC